MDKEIDQKWYSLLYRNYRSAVKATNALENLYECTALGTDQLEIDFLKVLMQAKEHEAQCFDKMVSKRISTLENPLK